jgi:hypothetical protein
VFSGRKHFFNFYLNNSQKKGYCGVYLNKTNEEAFMKTVFLFLIIPVLIFAQTEFFLTSTGVPIFNDCKVLRDSLPIECSITKDIRVAGALWNPDSLDWCTTKAGYYRSRDISHPPLWKIDNEITSQSTDNGFSISICVLDTLEHLLSATYLQYPTVSIRYKARNDTLPFLICSRSVKIFASDSIHMFIKSAFPVNYSDSQNTFKIWDDSARINSALLTFDHPADTSIKLTTFLCKHKSIYNYDYKATLSPSLNSYSILIPLNNILYLTKRKNMEPEDTTNDTIYAVFQKQSTFDTVRVHVAKKIFSGGYNVDAIKNSDRFQGYKSTNSTSAKNSVKIYDLNGRLVNNNFNGSHNSNNLQSKGIYLKQTSGDKTGTLYLENF